MATFEYGGDKGKATMPKWEGTFKEYLAHAIDKGGKRSKEGGRDDFSVSWSEAVRMAKEGWEHGVKALTDLQAAIFRNDRVESNEEYTRDMVGRFFDVGDFIAGEPEHWFEPVVERKQRRPIHIHVNSSFHCGVSKDNILRRGAVVAEVIDRLILNGPVDVTIHDVAGQFHHIVHMDMARGYSKSLLTFALASTGFHRRIMFGVLEDTMGEAWCQMHGYGYPTAIPADIKDAADCIVFCHYRDKDINVNKYSTDAKALEEAKRIVGAIEEQEQRLFEEA